MRLPNDVDEALLNAYIDDELASDERREVEAAVRSDPGLRSREAALREADGRLRDALRPALDGPMPPLRLPAGSRERAHWRQVADWLAAAPLPALSAPAAFVVGGVLGAWLFAGGSGIGSGGSGALSLPARTLQRTLESEVSGTLVTWRDPDALESGHVVAVRTFKNRARQHCREFEERHVRADAETISIGVACRESDGRWRVRIRYYE